MQEKKDKYGFIYIWRDRKHNRYYIGSHWGTVNDGYICSSTWMRHAHKRRPTDFKRRVVKRIFTNRQDLLGEEQRWIDMIPKDQFSVGYFNHNKKILHNAWWLDPERGKTVGERISQKNKGRRLSPNGEIKKGEHRGLTTEIKTGQRLSPKTELQPGHNTWNKGLTTSEETKRKLSISHKGQHSSPTTEFTKGFISWNKGIPWSEEVKKKNSKAHLKSHCLKGHEFTKENTRIKKKNGHAYKSCYQCQHLYQKAIKDKYLTEGCSSV